MDQKMKWGSLVGPVIALSLAVAPSSSTAGSDSAIERANNQVNVWFGKLRQDYKEFNDGTSPTLPAILDSESGTVPGITIDGGAFVKGGYIWLRQAHWKGETTYDGYIGTTPAKTTTDNVMSEGLMKGGYLFHAGEGFRVGPVLEFGMLLWNRQIGRGTTSAVEEDYRHFYYGLGLLGLYGITDDLSLKFEGTWGKTFGATITAPQFDFQDEKLGRETTIRGGLVADYRLTGSLHVMAGAETLQFGYGTSKVNSSGNFEPRSDTRRLSYKVGLGYSFR